MAIPTQTTTSSVETKTVPLDSLPQQLSSVSQTRESFQSSLLPTGRPDNTSYSINTQNRFMDPSSYSNAVHLPRTVPTKTDSSTNVYGQSTDLRQCHFESFQRNLPAEPVSHRKYKKWLPEQQLTIYSLLQGRPKTEHWSVSIRLSN